MAETVRGVAALHAELEKAKENLKGVDDNIKKLTGRTPGELRPGGMPGGPRRLSAGGPPVGPRRLSAGGRDDDIGAGRGRLFSLARRSIEESGAVGGPPAAKRRVVGGAFSRLGPRVIRGGPPQEPGERPDSGDEEELPHKPVVQSSVIATPQDTRTRQDKLKEEDSSSKESKQRNKRMFGLLLGTLSKFQAESKVKKEKEEQRQAIERKLEDRARAEKEEIRRERQELFQERKRQQQKLKRLEHKMELVQSHDEWEAQTRTLMNFIRTKAKPHLFYLPRLHNDGTEKKLAETGTVLEGIISDRRKQLEEEIEDLMNKDDADRGQGVKKQNGTGEEEEDGARDEGMDVSRDEGESQPAGQEDGSKETPTKPADSGRRKSSSERGRERRRSPSNPDRERRGGVGGRRSPDRRRSSGDARRRRSRERSTERARRHGDRRRSAGGDDKENRDRRRGRSRSRDRSRGKDRGSRERTGAQAEHKPLGLEQEEEGDGTQSDRDHSIERAIKKEDEGTDGDGEREAKQATGDAVASQPAEAEERIEKDAAAEKDTGASPHKEIVKRKSDDEESGKEDTEKDGEKSKKQKKKKKPKREAGDEDSGTEDSSSSSSSSDSNTDSENSEDEDGQKKEKEKGKEGETDSRRVVVDEGRKEEPMDE